MIYEIVCNETGERYIGSTFEKTVARRMVYHRSSTNNCMSKQIIGRGNYSYGLLEKVDVETRDELRMKERYWYDKLQNINHFRPFITKEEELEHNQEYKKKYYQEYKETILQKATAYQQEHKEQHNLTSNVYYHNNKEAINLKIRQRYALKKLVQNDLGNI